MHLIRNNQTFASLNEALSRRIPQFTFLTKKILHGDVDIGDRAPETASTLTEFTYPNLTNSNSNYCQEKQKLKN